MIAAIFRSKQLRAPRKVLLVAPIVGLVCGPAHALTFVDELTYYLTAGTFTPGGLAITRVTFATKPSIGLSAFSFEMTWSTPLVAPVQAGAGSLAAWGETLASRGAFTLGLVQAQSVSGRWVANALAPSPDVIDIPYSQPLQPMFSLQTAPQLNSSFVVSFQFYDIADAAGETVDTGSGFINWATMTPVPEPHTGLLWVCGALAAGAWRVANGRGRAVRPGVSRLRG